MDDPTWDLDLEGNVVVAVDGSEHADRAVRWAADAAALEHRRLVAIAVGESAGRAVDEAVAVANDLHPGLSVLARTVHGDPRRVLVDASAHAFELVMGSRGRGSLGSLLLGSVSATVARHAACPVVVCRPVGTGPRRAGAVVGADGTRESLPVVEFAYRQAYLRDMPLTVLHTFFDAAAAVARYREARGEPSAMPDLEQLRETLAQSVAGLDQDYPGVAVTLSVEHGMADQALTPRGDGWDLVVVGRHPMTTVDRLLTTSISIAVLERAHGTVAIVPEASEPDPV